MARTANVGSRTDAASATLAPFGTNPVVELTE